MVANDLVHWRELPLALPHDDTETVFSGSAVVDHGNTSGFGTPEAPAIVAIYTTHSKLDGRQARSPAYSTDNRRRSTATPARPSGCWWSASTPAASRAARRRSTSSATSTAPASPPPTTTATPPQGAVVQDFESSYGGWTTTGSAFGTASTTGALPGQLPVSGFEGTGYADSFHGGDGSTGSCLPGHRAAGLDLAGRRSGQRPCLRGDATRRHARTWPPPARRWHQASWT